MYRNVYGARLLLLLFLTEVLRPNWTPTWYLVEVDLKLVILLPLLLAITANHHTPGFCGTGNKPKASCVLGKLLHPTRPAHHLFPQPWDQGPEWTACRQLGKLGYKL